MFWTLLFRIRGVVGHKWAPMAGARWTCGHIVDREPQYNARWLKGEFCMSQDVRKFDSIRYYILISISYHNLFPYPLKTSETREFSHTFKGYRKEHWYEMGPDQLVL